MKKSLRSRVAAVAVAVLGMGMLAAVPASASSTCNPANQDGCGVGFTGFVYANYSNVAEITLKADASSKAVVGQTVRINMGADTTAVSVATNQYGFTSFAGYLSAAPADSESTLSAHVGDAADLCNGNFCDVEAFETSNAAGLNFSSHNDGNDILGNEVVASTTDNAGYFTFVPDSVGTYSVTVFHDPKGEGNLNLLASKKTISVTVVAPALSIDKSTVVLDTTKYRASTAAGVVTSIYASKSVGTDGVPATSAGNATVTVKDTADNDLAVYAITATVTGVGLVSLSNTRAGSVMATSKSVAGQSTAQFFFHSDGDGGKSTVTIKATTYNFDTVTLGTFDVYYYGTVATLTATSRYSAYDPSVVGSIPVRVAAADANGIAVPGLTVSSATANSTALLSAWACAGRATSGSTAASQVPGSYNCAPGVYSDAQGTGSYAFSTTLASLAVITSNAASVLVSDSKVASVTVAFDKTSYTPGSPVVVTVTAKNAKGNPVADNGTYTGLWASVTSPTFSTTAASAGTFGTFNLMAGAGQQQLKFFAPVADGPFSVTIVIGAGALIGTSVTAASTVTPAPSVADLQAKVAAITTTITALQTAISTLVASFSSTLTLMTAKLNKIMKKLKIK